MKYRKKPVVVEAYQYTGNPENLGWPEGWLTCDYCIDELRGPSKSNYILEIQTLEGLMIAYSGDYIIKGVKGEFYPCREDIFLATYDRVIESSASHMEARLPPKLSDILASIAEERKGKDREEE